MKTPFLAIALLSLIHCSEVWPAADSPVYTIQIDESEDLQRAKTQALEAARIVALPIRVERQNERYSVFVGAGEPLEVIQRALKQLRNAGYSAARVYMRPLDEDATVFSIAPEQSEKAVRKLEQRRQKFLSERDGLRAPIPATDQAKKVNRFVAIGWQFYNEENFSDAVRAFELALGLDASHLEAKYGLALSWLKSKHPNRALPLFEQLLAEHYRSDTILPQVIELLVDEQHYQRAQHYIDRLPQTQRAQWSTRLQRVRTERALAIALSNKDTAALIALQQRAPYLLQSCRMAWQLLEAATRLADAGHSADAVNIYQSLLTHCPKSWDVRVSAFDGLKSQLSPEQVNRLLSDELARRHLPADYQRTLKQVRVHVLQEQLSALPANAPQIETLANKILALQPDESGTRAKLAWWYFSQRQYQAALEQFRILHQADPNDHDYALGLMYTLTQLERIDQALEIADAYHESDPAFAQHQTVLLAEKANAAYADENFIDAERWLRKLLTIDPENRDAQELLAWTLYKNGKTQQAIPMFESMLDTDPSSELATVILSSYEAVGDHAGAVRSARIFGQHPSTEVRHAAGDYLFSQGWPIRAAQTHTGAEAPYSASRVPRFEITPSVRRRRGGRPGPSTLNEYALGLRYEHPIAFGKTLGVSVTPARLTSEGGDGALFTGSFFLSALTEGQPLRPLTTSATVVTPELEFEAEGDINVGLRLGTTPVNGPISPLPTFYIAAYQRNWSVNVHQQPVDESLLSYVGLQDPWSTQEWGRVLKTGFEVSGERNIFQHHWLSIRGGFDHYWGANVWTNQSYQGSIAIGTTRPVSAFDVSPGVYVFLQHFERNSNFYTFGHGGYFSPDFLLAVGPSVSFSSQGNGPFRLNGELSLGYVSYRTDGAPQFPLQSPFNAAPGRFQLLGERKDGLSGRVRLNGSLTITRSIEARAYFDLQKSPAFSEYGGGVDLTLYF